MSKESIRDGLLKRGFSKKAVLAIMGNMWDESGFRSNNAEDRLHREQGISDEQYTAMVDSGSYGLADFMYDRNRNYGYGLCQWTDYTRKEGLWKKAKAMGVSIGDENMQLDYLTDELNSGEFLPVLQVLRDGSAGLYDMVREFMVRFEKCADQSVSHARYRTELAERLMREWGWEEDGERREPDEAETDAAPDTPRKPFWPPRTLCKGMVGADVSVMQALLLARNYPAELTGEFDETDRDLVMAFQSERRLISDGIVGEKTWAALGVKTEK